MTTGSIVPGQCPIPDDAVRVTYIPENMKKQIRDEIKSDVMSEAKTKN